MKDSIVMTMTFLIYFLAMLGIGYAAWMKTKTSADYFLGGRSLGPWSTAISAGASDMSGWLLLGLPGYAFISGFEVFWLAAGLLVGSWLNWLIVAKRLRLYSAIASDSLTLPEFLANRFNEKKGFIQPISAAFILMFFLFYTSSGLVAGGKLFESVFNIDYHLALMIGTFSVISYTLFGGFLAVCWTDLAQGLLMSVALLTVPLMAFHITGGADFVFQEIRAFNPELLDMFTSKTGQPLSVIAVISLLGWGLGYCGQPHILARFKAIRSSHQLVFARRIACTWTAIGIMGSVLVGFAGIAYTRKLGISLDDPEEIFILMVNTLFHPIIAGVLLAAILAAIMSTADSQLLVCSTAFAEDFYKDIFKKKADQNEILFVGRCSVVIIAIIATILAWNPESSVLKLVSYAWAGFGAAFGPVLILSLYWRRITAQGALAGIIVGGLTVVVWSQLDGGIFDLYEIVPGILLSAIMIVIGSYLSKAPTQLVTDSFDTLLSDLACQKVTGITDKDKSK
ncbi:MAG: sodium/proline symporter PutP [Candidatus Endonucleobacter bathymodioli]|uniref:Sodium/proline symporter n=1 Tax=Candidatus Endonucleibacter bathymodioli TaxID=539814 RepID=A0AA90NVV9_9GAMM|nr:sodium/proline symporter PutP [Candidatus Endonucleobacter bathymodioli]